MRTNNIRLLVLISVMIAVNAWVFLSFPSDKSLGFDPAMYTVADTSVVSSIEIDFAEVKNRLTRDASWTLNNQYTADPSLLRILMNVLGQFQLSRSIEGNLRDELTTRKDQSISVSIVADRTIKFRIIGNQNRTTTYLIDEEDQMYQIEIPGYADYIGSIFELTTDQWRDRTIVNGNWRSIQKLTVDYTSESRKGLSISFDQDFFKVQGVSAIDSNAVVSYLNRFEYLQANERISTGKYPRYDSLMKTTPFAVLTIDDIYFNEPKRIRFFPVLRGERIQLVADPNGELVIFEPVRVRQLLKEPVDFQY